MREVKRLYPVASGVLSEKPVPMNDLPPVVLASDFDAQAAELERANAEIEKWSGTAVQNGMECDRLSEELKVARELLAEADNWVRVLRTQFDYSQTKGLAERIEAWQERNHA